MFIIIKDKALFSKVLTFRIFLFSLCLTASKTLAIWDVFLELKTFISTSFPLFTEPAKTLFPSCLDAKVILPVKRFSSNKLVPFTITPSKGRR